jgi:hypothetical protein
LNIPVEALFGECLQTEQQQRHLPDFYRYFDLCNEQAFLFERGRVTRTTWCNWREGIESNLTKPAFAAAWTEVSTRAPDDFRALRKLAKCVGSPTQ